MPRSRTRRSLHVTAFLLVVATAPPALAQQPAPSPPPTDTRDAARAAANRGLQRFQEGKYEEAIASFREAEALFHAPTILIMIGHAHDRLGHLLEARAIYRQVIDEPLVHYAPREFFEAQEEAKRSLADLEPRIPTLRVLVDGITAYEVNLRIDGAAASPGTAIPLNPGEHDLTVAAPGRATIEQRVTLRERDTAELRVELTPIAPAPSPPPAPRSEPAPPRRDAPAPARAAAAPRSSERLVPAITAFGVAGLSLAVGAVTGVVSLNEVAALKESCPAGKCYDDVAGPYDTAQALATTSTVAFVIAGVAAATGATLLLWPRSADQSAQLRVVAAPGWIGMTGGF